MRYCRNRDQKKVKMHGVLYRSMVQYFASMCKPLMSFPLLPPSSASRAIPSCMFINVMMMKKKKKSGVVLLYDDAVFLVSSRYQIVVSQLQQYSSYSFDCNCVYKNTVLVFIERTVVCLLLAEDLSLDYLYCDTTVTSGG